MVDPQKRDSMDASTDLTSKLSTTHLDAQSSKPRPLGFTDLPASVRNKIYAHVLDTELVNAGQPNVSYTHTIKDGLLRFAASRPPFPVQTALFYVGRKVGQEARRWFYAKNLWIRLEVYSGDARHAKSMVEDSGILFSTTSPDQCTQHAMDIRVAEKDSKVKRAAVLFPAQYLPRLINFMEQASQASSAWARSQALRLTVRHTYEFEVARVQGDLLEGFRLLTNIGAVEVEGKDLLDGYAEGLKESMTAPSFDAEAWLAVLNAMTDRAERAHKENEHGSATQHCHTAVIATTYGYLTRAEILHAQAEVFTKAIQRLRWRAELLLASTLQASTSPAALLAAERAASHALSLSTDSPSPASNPWVRSLPAEHIPPNNAAWFTDEERGRSWFVLGLVHMALGENLFAAGDLERAVGLMAKGDEGLRVEVDKAFEKAREGINWEIKPGARLRRRAWEAWREGD